MAKLFFLKIFERTREWTLKWAHSPHMAAGLFLIAFMEASFFPVPPDILLIAILMIRSERWLFYAALTTAGSVSGAFLGYAIGWGFYETVGYRIAQAYHLTGAINSLGAAFKANAFLAVFTAAFTFIPFKVFTIAAGLFKISIWQMFFASIVGRGLRFLAVAWLINRFGARMSRLVYKYFNVLSIAFVLLLAAGFLVIKLLF